MDLRKLLLPLAIVLTVTSLRAADPVNELQIKGDAKGQRLALIADAAAETEPAIPKRELKFDVSEEEESLPLQNVQEGMLDQRYVATFRLVIPKNEKYENRMSQAGLGAPPSRITSDEPGNLSAHQQLLRSWLRYNSAKSGLVENARIATLESLRWANPIPVEDARRLEKFENIQLNIFNIVNVTPGRNGNVYSFAHESGLIAELASFMPEQHRPAKEIYEVFTAPNPPFILMHCPDAKRRGIPGTENPTYLVNAGVMAPTAEQAKQWAECWLAFYDWGLCYPAQLECLQVIKHLKEELAKNREIAAKLESDGEKYKKQIEETKEFDDIKPEALAALITQRRLLSIDQKGAKARIEACDNMLAELKRNQERNTIANRQQSEAAKVAAEIELVGLAAKYQEIDRIIQGVQSRQGNWSKLTKAEQELSWRNQIIDQENGVIEVIERYQLGYQPLPVEDGKITVRRIKWTNPPKPEEPKK
jgi:hypothetical protein